MNRKFEVFNKKVSRAEAEQIIINDKIAEIVGAKMIDALDWILTYGWKPLEKWTRKEIQEELDNLLEENQWDRED